MKRFIHIILILLVGLVSCQKAPFLTFNGQKSFTFKDTGGSESITFTCNRAWSVKSSESWLTISPAQGDANEEGARVTITCAANTTYDPRTATITIMSEGLSETISVSQDTNYGLLSEPTTFNLTNAAQTIEIEVKANVEYTVTIDDASKDWISQAGTKALSSTKLSFNIAANESYDDREGKITISPKGNTSVQTQIITVKQSQTNGLFITTPEYELSNESHNLTIEVNANVDYEVTPEVDWIKYEASSTKALSTTNFTLKVDKNETYDQRVGTVKVKGGGLEGVITITQAENLGLFVSPTEVQISKDAQEVEVEVNANVEYDIIVPDEAKGMITTIKTEGGDTKALVAKKVRFGVSENKKYEGREASVTFKQKDGALCGTVKISQEQTDFLEISPVKDSVSWKGGVLKFSLSTNVHYSIEGVPSWAAMSDAKKLGEENGLSTYEYELTISENDTFSPKYATILFSSETLEASFIAALGELYYVKFDDEVFKSYCVRNFDKDGDEEISVKEAQDVSRINVMSQRQIYSLKGVEEFENIKELLCDQCQLSNLNVSGCAKLQRLACEQNHLTSLDISGCFELQTLYCGYNMLTKLDVSGCTKLQELLCYNNKLASLDVSKCIELYTLKCESNQLTTLDVSGCTKLQDLYCCQNKISNLNVSGCAKLIVFDCHENKLSSLDVSNCAKLQTLQCGSNQIASLEVTCCNKLKTLGCEANKINNIDVSDCRELQYFYCNQNQLTSLDVSKCTELTALYCSSNNLTSLDVSGCTELASLYCYSNPNLFELWLKTGQTIEELSKDSQTVIKYKD